MFPGSWYDVVGHHPSLAQPAEHFEASAMQPGFDGADGALEGEGYVFVGLSLFVVKHKNGPILQAQIRDRRLNLAHQFGAIVGSGARYGVLQVVDRLRSSRSPRHPGATAVDRDTHDPRPQRPTGIPASQAAKDTQEDFLCHILGVVSVVQKANAQSEHFCLKAGDEAFNRVGIAAEATLNQGYVVHGRSQGSPRRLKMGYPDGWCEVSGARVKRAKG